MKNCVIVRHGSDLLATRGFGELLTVYLEIRTSCSTYFFVGQQ